jgi:hypothetical protein
MSEPKAPEAKPAAASTKENSPICAIDRPSQQRRLRIGTGDAEQQDVERGLQRHHQKRRSKHQPDVGENEVEIDQQPDREEEHHQKNALDRFDHRDDAAAKRRVADDDARKKRAIDRRQPGQPGQGGRRKAQRQRSDASRSTLFSIASAKGSLSLGLRPNHHSKPASSATATTTLKATSRDSMLLAAKARNQDQHRHHGQVLGDQHADRDLPGSCAIRPSHRASSSPPPCSTMR